VRLLVLGGASRQVRSVNGPVAPSGSVEVFVVDVDNRELGHRPWEPLLFWLGSPTITAGRY